MKCSRILVVAPAWIGDLVISISFLNALRKINPNSKIDLLINENLSDIARSIPYISNVIVSKTKHGKLSLFYRIKLGMNLRKQNYTHCYILSNSLKSSIVPLVAGIQNRISYLGEFRYGFINKIKQDFHRKDGMANRYLNLIDKRYIEDFKPTINHVTELKHISNKFKLKDRYITLCPDAEFGPAKRWPSEKWLELAERISDDFQVVLVGQDKSINHKLKDLNKKNFKNLIGKTSLDDVMKILQKSYCVVANDSGLMHVAAALGRPVVGIYGSSSPDYTPPLIEEDKKIVLYENLSCSPCYKRVCPLSHTDCLNNISVENVKDSISKLVKQI